jgi:hypothetical protein
MVNKTEFDKLIDVYLAEYFFDTPQEIRLALRDFAEDVKKLVIHGKTRIALKGVDEK